jgi:predicted amidohydrolase YtcJ
MVTLRALPMLALLAASPLAAASSTEDADLLLTHGVFYPTADGQPAEGVPPAVHGALAVRDGRIVFLGDDVAAAKLRGAATHVIDLAGRAVTPGLIDAHAHLAGYGDELGRVDLAGTASYSEVIARVTAAARQVPAGTWIRGRGWDQNDWDTPGHPFPDQRALSAAVPDHPVWLTRIDGHASLLNARALAELGVTDQVVDPPGGKFLRFADGTLTGVLVDNAADDLETRLPQPDRAERMRRLRLAAERCLALGLTTVTDMGVDAPTLDAYVALRERGELPIRAAVFLTDNPELLADAFARGPRLDPQARLVVRGVKLYADGALGSRGAALVEPYDDDPTNLGLLRTSTDHVAEVAAAAIAHGFQVGIHAIGDRGSLIALDGIERAFAGQPRPELRFRVEHAQVMREQDIARMARLGVIASMQPTHATSDMPWAGDRVGETRLAGAYAWRKVLVAGGRLALGSDFPVESADPRLGLYAAVSRQDLAGNPPDGWRPEERLSRAEALRGFTRDAAWSLFLEHETGALEVGRRADLVVWASDPMTVPTSGIPTAAVDLTLLDGEVVFRREAAP